MLITHHTASVLPFLIRGVSIVLYVSLLMHCLYFSDFKHNILFPILPCLYSYWLSDLPLRVGANSHSNNLSKWFWHADIDIDFFKTIFCWVSFHAAAGFIRKCDRSTSICVCVFFKTLNSHLCLGVCGRPHRWINSGACERWTFRQLCMSLSAPLQPPHSWRTTHSTPSFLPDCTAVWNTNTLDALLAVINAEDRWPCSQGPTQTWDLLLALQQSLHVVCGPVLFFPGSHCSVVGGYYNIAPVLQCPIQLCKNKFQLPRLKKKKVRALEMITLSSQA